MTEDDAVDAALLLFGKMPPPPRSYRRLYRQRPYGVFTATLVYASDLGLISGSERSMIAKALLLFTRAARKDNLSRNVR